MIRGGDLGRVASEDSPIVGNNYASCETGVELEESDKLI